MTSEFEAIIDLVENKIKDISSPVLISDELLQSLEKNITLLNVQIESNNKEIQAINIKKNRINEENKSIRVEICKSAFYNLVTQHRTNITSVLKLRSEWKKLNEKIKKLKRATKSFKTQ